MDKRVLINIVKYNNFIYTPYFYVGSVLLSFLKLFLKADKKLIVFGSFGGRKFDDSPKAIYEAMINDSRFNGYKLVWTFINPDNYEIQRGFKVKVDTLRYYVTLLKARVWVTNSSMTRGLAFCGINTLQLNSWHGSAIKVMGVDINSNNSSFGVKNEKINKKDYMLAQSPYDVDVFTKAFNRDRDSFRVIGLPRNDILARCTPELKDEMKRKLGILSEKRVILYAPTFREYEKDDGSNCTMSLQIDFEKWKKYLGGKYIVLFRAHYEVIKTMNIVDDDFVRDVSSYPSLDDLMLASDMLISDYSSIFFDYSIMHKPMLCFCYDYDKYQKERGMYFDIREWIPYAAEEKSLIQLIKETDVFVKDYRTKMFQEKFVTEYGNATERSLDIIYTGIAK